MTELTPQDIELANRVEQRFADRYPMMSAPERLRACHEILTHEVYSLDPLGRLATKNGAALVRLGYGLMLHDRYADTAADSERFDRALAGDDYVGRRPAKPDPIMDAYSRAWPGQKMEDNL